MLRRMHTCRKLTKALSPLRRVLPLVLLDDEFLLIVLS